MAWLPQIRESPVSPPVPSDWIDCTGDHSIHRCPLGRMKSTGSCQIGQSNCRQLATYSREGESCPRGSGTLRLHLPPQCGIAGRRQKASSSLECAGPETRENVVAIRREEVAIGRPSDALTGRPAPAAQYLARVEPRLRVVSVGICSEPCVRPEVRSRPLPDIADHLAAAESAVAFGTGGDGDRTVERIIEIGAGGRGRRVAPRPSAAGASTRRIPSSVGIPMAPASHFQLRSAGDGQPSGTTPLPRTS